MTKQAIGSNITATIEGDTLTLTIDLATTLGPSRSGKTTLIASTNGNAVLPDGSRLGLNVYRPAGTSEASRA